MALGIGGLRGALIDHMLKLGVYDSVSPKPVKTLPGTGVHAVVQWLRSVPARTSGLASTSLVVIFTVYVLVPLEQEPAEDVDLILVDAVDPFMASLIAGFTLGGLVRMVDVRGSEQAGGGSGAGLTATSGVMTFPEKKYRFAEITVPLVCNDVYDEAP